MSGLAGWRIEELQHVWVLHHVLHKARVLHDLMHALHQFRVHMQDVRVNVRKCVSGRAFWRQILKLFTQTADSQFRRGPPNFSHVFTEVYRFKCLEESV